MRRGGRLGRLLLEGGVVSCEVEVRPPELRLADRASEEERDIDEEREIDGVDEIEDERWITGVGCRCCGGFWDFRCR